MINPPRITSIMFDFDGTLCLGRYFEPLGQDALDAIAQLVFGENSAQWADPWMRGALTSEDVAAYLSTHLPQSKDDILSALHAGCASMTLNPAVLEFASRQRQAGRRTALVTANMDVFSEVVVPAHGLDTLFDVVLNTADHRTLDKSILWRKAFSAFGSRHDFSSALLIDDSPRMTELFESSGGHAHRYTDDHAFQAWTRESGMCLGT